MSRATAIAALSVAAVLVAAIVLQTWLVYGLLVIAVVGAAALWIYLSARKAAPYEADEPEHDNAPTGVRPSSQG